MKIERGIRICRTGKQDYATEEEASDALQAIRQVNQNRSMSGLDVPNRVYLCDFCLAWHLTHRQKKK